jgi:putative transposase
MIGPWVVQGDVGSVAGDAEVGDLDALREFEWFYDSHRPHRGIANARHCNHCPHRSPSPAPPPSFTDEISGMDRHPSRVPACCLTSTDE